MKSFENVNDVKKKATTIRIVTGIIAILILPVLISALFNDYGPVCRELSGMVVGINTTLYLFASWVETKLKNVY